MSEELNVNRAMSSFHLGGSERERDLATELAELARGARRRSRRSGSRCSDRCPRRAVRGLDERHGCDDDPGRRRSFVHLVMSRRAVRTAR